MQKRARTRVRNLGPVTADCTRYVNGSPTNVFSTITYKSDEVIDDYVVPNFQAQIRAGNIINNPMTYVKDTLSPTLGGVFNVLQNGVRYELRSGSNPSSMTEGMYKALGSYPQYQGTYVDPPLRPEAAMIDSAKFKALSYLDKTPYSFAEDVAEMRDTARFLKNPFSSLRQLGKEFQKDLKTSSKKSKTKDRAQLIADAWTEYRFAASPLVRSANDALESIFQHTRRPPRRTARGITEFKDSLESSIQGTAYVWDRSWEIESVEKAGILYEVTNPVNDWRFKYGLRFKDIPETMWAIMPYSFMVDRVSNISGAIRGFTNFIDPRVKILAAWSTEKSTYRKSLSFIDYVSAGVTEKTITPDRYWVEQFIYNRQPWSPSVLDIKPGFNLGGLTEDLTKTADLAALILQRFK